jgi:hypothetical protein
MPNRRVHLRAGAAVGAGAALVQAIGQRPQYAMLEAFGGAIAGAMGGATPDVMESSARFGPNHRDSAHSAMAIAGVVKTAVSLNLEWVQHWRQLSDRLLAAVEQEGVGSPRRLTYQLQGMAARVAAGMLAGFAAGYLSHLVLDAETPKGLPLVGTFAALSSSK